MGTRGVVEHDSTIELNNFSVCSLLLRVVLGISTTMLLERFACLHSWLDKMQKIEEKKIFLAAPTLGRCQWKTRGAVAAKDEKKKDSTSARTENGSSSSPRRHTCQQQWSEDATSSLASFNFYPSSVSFGASLLFYFLYDTGFGSVLGVILIDSRGPCIVSPNPREFPR
jgi:hypothetical protein